MGLEGKRVGAEDVRAALTGRLLYDRPRQSPKPPTERWRPGFTRDIHDFMTGRHPLAGGRIRYLLDGLVEADLARWRMRAPLRALPCPDPPMLRPGVAFDALPESASVLRRGRLDGAAPRRLRRRLAALAWGFEVTRRRPGLWTADDLARLVNRGGNGESDRPVMLTEAVRDLWRARRRLPFARAQARRFEAYLLLSHMDWFGVGPREIPAPWERPAGVSRAAGRRPPH